MMQQGKVIVRLRLLMDLDRLRELGHHWGKGLLVVEPMGKQMPTHTRHLGCDPDDFCARGHRPITVSATRAALRTIEPPGGSPPIDMAQVHRNRQLPLGDLIEQHPARALWLLLEQAPQQSLLNFTELSSRTKRWTRNLSEVILLQGEWHGFILLEQDFRMKSVHSLLQVNAHFYPQQNQLIRNKISKPCRKRVYNLNVQDFRTTFLHTFQVPQILDFVSIRHLFKGKSNGKPSDAKVVAVFF